MCTLLELSVIRCDCVQVMYFRNIQITQLGKCFMPLTLCQLG